MDFERVKRQAAAGKYKDGCVLGCLTEQQAQQIEWAFQSSMLYYTERLPNRNLSGAGQEIIQIQVWFRRGTDHAEDAGSPPPAE